METRSLAAALALSLAFTGPVGAQEPVAIRGTDAGGTGPAERRGSAYLPIGGTGSAITVSSRPFIEEDGTAAYRKTLVGSWSLDRRMRVGVGLIEVTRTSPREPALRRARPMEDTGGRSDHIAAIGLSIRF